MSEQANDHQQMVLEFQAITGLESFDECRQVLEACDWNMERAVQVHMAASDDLYTLPSVADVVRAHQWRQRTEGGTPRAAAPEFLVEPPAAPAARGYRWGIVGAGLGFVGAVVGGLWGFVTTFTAPLWRLFFGGPARTDGAAAAAAFTAAFEAQYGTTHPRFHPGGFADAAAVAQGQSRLLVVYLHSNEHVACPAFCREALSSATVTSFLDENFLMWAGDVSEPEAAHMNNVLGATTYPFLAVIANLQGTRQMTVLQRFEGSVSADELCLHLTSILEQHHEIINEARAQGVQRATDRMIREEQDAAFQAALHADQQREREQEQARQRDEEARRAAESATRAAQDRATARARRRERAVSALGSEPSMGPGVCRIRLMLPDGTRADRRFASSDQVEVLYLFAETHDLGETDDYMLVMPNPRKEFTDRSVSLEAAGLYPHGAQLLVQAK